MEKINVTSLVEWTAAASTTYLVGTSYSLVACGIPAIQNIKDTRIAQHAMKDIFNKAARRVGPVVLLGTASPLLAWYCSTSTEFKWLYLAGAGAIFTVIPFTVLTMSSDLKEMANDNLIEQKGEKWVRDAISSLKKKQMFKTFMIMLASDLCFLGILLSR